MIDKVLMILHSVSNAFLMVIRLRLAANATAPQKRKQMFWPKLGTNGKKCTNQPRVQPNNSKFQNVHKGSKTHLKIDKGWKDYVVEYIYYQILWSWLIVWCDITMTVPVSEAEKVIKLINLHRYDLFSCMCILQLEKDIIIQILWKRETSKCP